ncbi:tyrosine-type recombinase/integrase [Scatolibacter rhodanostii]|uniref:tyrosine-type recombinase/integrase n=1 Tax=Scatolibacter rhodanostii TaxID=2014781 RepID=UPI0013566DBD|nr:site-specific integrase [Scatolibacter rhodanostii]
MNQTAVSLEKKEKIALPEIFVINTKKEYTIGEWMPIWFQIYSHVDLKDSTILIYKDAYRRLLVEYPEVNNILLSDFSPITFQMILNSLGEKYAKSTVRHIKLLFNKCYRCAIENKLCQENPIKSSIVPKNASEKIIEGLSSQEQKKLEDILLELPAIDDFILRFLLYTGLRRSEFLTLTWSDWDNKNGVLNIRESKTKNGIREVPLIPETSAILTFLKFQREQAKTHSSYIFTKDDEPISKYHLRHICSKASKMAGIRHVSPHMLRHTCATRLIESGADAKTVSDILGHKSVSFTLKTYVNIDREHKINQMQLLSKGKF